MRFNRKLGYLTTQIFTLVYNGKIAPKLLKSPLIWTKSHPKLKRNTIRLKREFAVKMQPQT